MWKQMTNSGYGQYWLFFLTHCYGCLKLDSLQECTYIIFMIEFEWDPKKSDSNLKKHGVSFYEAKSVFYDEFTIQFFDDENSLPSEDRFLMLGMSNESRILVVCHCEREQGSTIRIISARKATSKERKFYEG